MNDFGPSGLVFSSHSHVQQNDKSYGERNPRAHEHWRPDYEFISLADLFVMGGQILEPQVKYHDAIVESLKPMEEHLLDVFNFYARLKRTQ